MLKEMQAAAYDYSGTQLLCFTTVGLAVLVYMNRDLTDLVGLGDASSVSTLEDLDEVEVPLLDDSCPPSPPLMMICVEEPPTSEDEDELDGWVDDLTWPSPEGGTS